MTRASDTQGAVLSKEGLPGWLDPVVRAVETVRPTQLSRFLPPADGAGRQSAVLILFGDGTRGNFGDSARENCGNGTRGYFGDSARENPGDGMPDKSGGATRDESGGDARENFGDAAWEDREWTGRGPELLLMERAGSLRSHPGQPAFPGGALDPEDGDPRGDGPLRAALREAEEETGLDPAGVQLFGVLPKLYIPVSGFVVTPVLAWWREPSPVGVVDPGETARVFTVPVADLTDPANRVTAVHPSGHRGPAFLVESALVWGFTAGVIDRLLHFAGWERPWDREKQVPLDWRA